MTQRQPSVSKDPWINVRVRLSKWKWLKARGRENNRSGSWALDRVIHNSMERFGFSKDKSLKNKKK